MRAYRVEMTSLFAAICVLSLLAFTSAAYAEGGRDRGFGGGFGMGGQHRMSDRMADRLGLDATQRQTLKNIFEASKPERAALREQRRSNRTALAALDSGADDYAIDLERLAAENGRLANEATLLFSRVRAEVDAVLTEEQRAKLEQFKQRGKKRGQRGKRRHRGDSTSDSTDADGST